MNKIDKLRLEDMHSKYHKVTKIERNKERKRIIAEQKERDNEVKRWLDSKIPKDGYLFIDIN